MRRTTALPNDVGGVYERATDATGMRCVNTDRFLDTGEERRAVGATGPDKRPVHDVLLAIKVVSAVSPVLALPRLIATHSSIPIYPYRFAFHSFRLGYRTD